MGSDTKLTNNHSLTLELGYQRGPNPQPPKSDGDGKLILTLGLSTGAEEDRSGGGAVSSGGVKRERESSSSEEMVTEMGFNSWRASDEDEDATCHNITTTTTTRKKLRLTKDQSALLEQSFKLRTTLNPKQKQALAERLHLRPRQVEVWFQNRRARTKLKQTEVDCEYLKKCCETLTDENKRLQKEVEELKSMKMAAPPQFYMQLPAATLSMCPSCERIAAGSNPAVPSKTAFAKPHFLPPFPNPSAAC